MQPSNESSKAKLLQEPTVQRISARDYEAIFLPAHGMLCASLKYKGVEVLRRLEDLDGAATKGSTAGIPLLYPWANRLSQPEYTAAGKRVVLDTSSPFLHLDSNRLPMHGMPWAQMEWQIVEVDSNSLTTSLEWNRRELLSIFPFAHRLEMTATLDDTGLQIDTAIEAEAEPVPVSFGFHPYFGLESIDRSEWHLFLPAMRRLVLDSRGIPTGQEEKFDGFDGLLGDDSFDDCFATIGESPSFYIEGGGRRVTVTFSEGYGYAQIFAPKGKDFIALEPMTAPTNALISGQGLSLVGRDARHRASFKVTVA